MSALASILVVIVGSFGPEWAGVVLLLPLIVLEANGLINAAVAVGPIDLRVQDLLLILLVIRWITRSMLRPTAPIHAEVLAVVAFLVGLVAMTVLAAGNVPEEATSTSAQALARLAAQCTVIAILATSNLANDQISRLNSAIEWFMLASAASVYWTYFMGPRGLPFGELQGLETGQLRAFGLVGDSVGFLLVFGVLLDVQRRRIVRAAFQLLAIGLTGTLGALLVLGVAFVAVWWTSIRTEGRRSSAAWAVPLTLVVLAVAVERGGGVIAQRIESGNLLESGSGLQRAVTASLALDVARDRPFGVGYQGFSVLAYQVGAAEVFADRMMGGLSDTFVANAGNQYLQTYTDGGGLVVLLLALFLMLSAKGLMRAALASTGSNAAFFRAGFAWVVGIALGNQSAVWVLPSGLILLLMLTVIGAALAQNRSPLHPSPASPVTLGTT
jgi:hypothetical protein